MDATESERNRWPSMLNTDGAAYSALTIGVMIDESVGGEINVVCPKGRVAVTSELSIDLAWPDATTIGSLRCTGELVAVTPDRALAQGTLRTESGVVVATASTWCIFIDGGGLEASGFWSAYAPPPELTLDALLTIQPADDATVRARLRADPRVANDLGNLHGGVLLAAMHDVGRAALAPSLVAPRTTSVRVNYLRPGQLDSPLDFEATQLHAGRTVGVSQIRSRNSVGKITAIATVTACAGAL